MSLGEAKTACARTQDWEDKVCRPTSITSVALLLKNQSRATELSGGRASASVLEAGGDSRNGAENQVDEVRLLTLAELLLVVAPPQGSQGAYLGDR